MIDDSLEMIWKVLWWRSRYPRWRLDIRKRRALDVLSLWCAGQVDSLTNSSLRRRTLVRRILAWRILVLMVNILLMLLLLPVHVLVRSGPGVTSRLVGFTSVGVVAKSRAQGVGVVNWCCLRRLSGRFISGSNRVGLGSWLGFSRLGQNSVSSLVSRK